MKFDLSLYLVTDSRGMNGSEFLERVEAALRGGVTLVQLREKSISSREYYELALLVHKLCRRYGVPMLIDDRVDIAMAVGAEGVHVGSSDLGVDIIRKIAGNDMIIGSTAKSVSRALEEQAKGADYLGVGAVYPTATKTDAVGIDMEEFRRITDAVEIPVTAIGGLNGTNLDILNGSGVDGIAVVSAIMHADDPEAAARELKRKFETLR